MGRKAEPGILYYSMKCDHVDNKKIRLLFNEAGPAGYWVWQCVIASAYRSKGYFYDASDREELEIFAQDTCKMGLEEVERIIEVCCRRRLFDAELCRDFAVLTSPEMQTTFLNATAERRRKGTIIEIREDFLRLSQAELAEFPVNNRIVIVPAEEGDLPRRKVEPVGIVPRNNPQSKVKESKGKESKEGTIVPAGQPAADEPEEDGSEKRVREIYSQIEKTKIVLFGFLKQYSPSFIEPYVDYWNLFAAENGMPQVKMITDTRRKKFRTRIKEKTFAFTTILRKAAGSEFIQTHNFFTFDWILEGPTNYVRVLEGNYDDKKTNNDDTSTQQRREQATTTDRLEASIIAKADG